MARSFGIDVVSCTDTTLDTLGVSTVIVETGALVVYSLGDGTFVVYSLGDGALVLYSLGDGASVNAATRVSLLMEGSADAFDMFDRNGATVVYMS